MWDLFAVRPKEPKLVENVALGQPALLDRREHVVERENVIARGLGEPLLVGKTLVLAFEAGEESIDQTMWLVPIGLLKERFVAVQLRANVACGIVVHTHVAVILVFDEQSIVLRLPIDAEFYLGAEVYFSPLFPRFYLLYLHLGLWRERTAKQREENVATLRVQNGFALLIAVFGMAQTPGQDVVYHALGLSVAFAAVAHETRALL